MDRIALAAALDRLGVPKAAMALRRPACPWVTVLTYHRVAVPDPASPFDDAVVDVTPEQLERQLEFVTRWFHPIALEDLSAHVRGGRRMPSNPLLVTFDDGYRDNHDVALPILQRRSVPATFFVATEFIERRRLFWWDRVAFLLKRSTRETACLEYPEPLRLSLVGPRARLAASRRVLRIIKDRRGLDLERFLDALEEATGARIAPDDERRLAEETLMTWDQVRALRRAGMAVQSHTRTHRVLRTLGASELAAELVGSRAKLEEELGEPVRAISYPVGNPVRGDPDVRRAVREAGYELGFSNGTGVNVLALDALDVKRISLDVELDDAFFRIMLALPWMAYRAC
jgi:peptidoglycan/xylan/chitin deacetylase (PgdA/CDA1 family)